MARPAGATATASPLETPFGRFNLSAPPGFSAGISPWCTADTLLLEAAKAASSNSAAAGETQRSTILTVNDSYGALSIPTAAKYAWTDSALSYNAINLNASVNEVPPPVFLDSVAPLTGQAHTISLVLLRVPKQLNYFEYQLNHLAKHLSPGTIIQAAGMDKHLSPQTASLLEKHLGTTTRHRGQRKARLFTSVLEKPGSDRFTGATGYFCEPLGAQLQSLPNVFSQQSLDLGARLMLEVLHTADPADTVMDLGCGNGVLGLFAGMHGGATTVTFCDESAMAVAAAQANAQRLLSSMGKAADYLLHWGDGLHGFSGPKADRIIVNPPFHAGHRVDAGAGRRLLAQCAEHLLPEGEVLVVANRHLNYQPTLKRDLADISLVGQNNKFVVIRARHRRS